MIIRVKNTVESARALLRDSVPSSVVSEILGKIVQARQNDGSFVIKARFFSDIESDWRIAPECVEIITQE